MGRRTSPLRARSAPTRSEPSLDELAERAAQFANDVKNPLAALKGAAEYLREELRRRGAPEEERAFVALILANAERVQHAIEAHEQVLARGVARRRL